MQQLLKSLDKKGYAIVNRATQELFEQIAKKLGREILRTDVHVNASQPAAVFSSEPIEWHQDSTEARWMAWFCINPGEEDLECTEILPMDHFINELSAQQKKDLSRVTVIDRLSGGDEIIKPLFNGKSFYYCPWLIKGDHSAQAKIALAKFREQLQQAASKIHRQDWRRDQILIIDNHRCLHRRPKLNPNSPRHLLRLWLAEPG